jgi:hypothetical protein
MKEKIISSKFVEKKNFQNYLIIFFFLLQNSRAESISANQTEPIVPHSIRSHSIVTSPTEDKSKKIKLTFMQHLIRKSPLINRKQVRKRKEDFLFFLLFIF